MIKKVGIVVDSSTTLTKKEAEKLGLYFVPIIIDYEGKEYESGVNIDNEFLWKNLTKDSNVKTAAVRLSDLTNQIKKASKENEVVFVTTLSKHLSSINDSAKLIAKDFKNVEVLDSELTPPWSSTFIKDVAEAAKKGDVEKVKKILTSQDGKMSGYLLPKSMDSLYAGGRVSKAQYLIGSLAKINVIIPIWNGSLVALPAEKARGAEKAIQKAVKLVMKKYQEYTNEGIKAKIFVTKSNDNEGFENLKNEIKNIGYKGEVIETILSPAIACHTGPKTIAVGIIINWK